MKKIATLLVALVAMVSLMSSCCQCETYEKKHGKPLDQSVWRLSQWNGQAVEAGDGFYFILDGKGTFAGRAACNNIGGNYSVVFDEPTLKLSGKLTFKDMFSTRMLCPDDAKEQAFNEMLDSVETFAREGSVLYLFANSELKAVFQAE